MRVAIHIIGLHGPVTERVEAVSFATLGYYVVGFVLFAWALSVAVWRFGRLGRRLDDAPRLHSHEHSHADGMRHWHKHFH